ncbi:MAG: hypothetical protein KDM91_22185 [Verrucomicrobiae bacterium]|nr:hypothetical protein [Verrucomicrobiae bacterium]MCP5541789.1 hypothetical protein [Akkermansiaceae bacterium]
MTDLRWFCVRTKAKSEHLAGRFLENQGDIETLCPRIAFDRATARGRVRFVEALFPGYLFARFDLAAQLRRVLSASSVTGVVHFGGEYPAVPEELIASLRAEFAGAEPREVAWEIREGDEVEIVSGVLTGLKALVTRHVPGRDRVRVLLEWLGQEREAEISVDSVAGGRRRPLDRGAE